jgi:PAS domain S-box-containing protein
MLQHANLLHTLEKALALAVDGDLTVRLDVPAMDEMKHLAGYFNDLMARLESCSQELREQIEERRDVEKQLQDSQALFNSFMGHLPALAFIKDREGRYLYLNEACQAMFNEEPAQRIGKTDEQLWPEAVAAEMRASDGMVLKSGQVQNAIERVQMGDETLYHQVTKFPIYKDGAPVMLGGIAFDITDRVRAEDERTSLQAQLIQAQKMEAIGTLAGGIAHDFNNILSAVMGHVEIAQLDLASDHPIHQHLSQVLKATHRAKDLVRQILTFSRKSEVNKKPLRLTSVIQEALKLLRASLPATIEIQTDLTTDQDIILADQTQIHQVIMNLCANSAFAMAENGGVLEIGLIPMDLNAKTVRKHFNLAPGRYIALKVSDTGTGMTANVRERIFDPFFTTKDLGQGTGMGLAVVHGIVKNHGGGIAVESEPGKGTQFEILFPRMNGEVLTEKHPILAPLGGSERILFIDDEQFLIDVAKQMLERLGYQVQAESNPLKAIEAFSSRPDHYDLVITDMTMPHLPGDSLARRLQTIRPDIPIILCTGYSERINDEKAAALGIHALMEKPLSIDELSRTIRKILDAPRQMVARAC